MKKLTKEMYDLLVGRFDIRKYDKTSEMNIIDWYQSFSVRHLILVGLDLEQEKGTVDENLRDSVLSIFLNPIPATGSKQAPFLKGPYNPVNDLPLIHIKRISTSKLQVVLDEFQNGEKGKTGEKEGIGEEDDDSSFGYNIVAVEEYYSDGSIPAIKVDLNYSDEDLVIDFKKWLNIKRNSDGIQSFRELPICEKDMEIWGKNRVLAYLDLQLMARLFNSRITNSMIGNLLFPDDLDIDSTEKIRKVVQPKVSKILDMNFMNALQSAASTYANNILEN